MKGDSEWGANESRILVRMRVLMSSRLWRGPECRKQGFSGGVATLLPSFRGRPVFLGQRDAPFLRSRHEPDDRRGRARRADAGNHIANASITCERARRRVIDGETPFGPRPRWVRAFHSKSRPTRARSLFHLAREPFRLTRRSRRGWATTEERSADVCELRRSARGGNGLRAWLAIHGEAYTRRPVARHDSVRCRRVTLSGAGPT